MSCAQFKILFVWAFALVLTAGSTVVALPGRAGGAPGSASRPGTGADGHPRGTDRGERIVVCQCLGGRIELSGHVQDLDRALERHVLVEGGQPRRWKRR
jgi:hypothetical protein